ncbi:capsule assembly Wzi family protein [Pelagicoccus sp. SDUM812003]|uniref:capsule assembly Wzi family protein n=1 Tax=Pelagicoccus sp. SDUM812003 TaxID=3041267 RepID=UPI00280CA98A|nr:capsule assembly Wzi family protein [Pelagicoccus sp. SDUM812003]MDQ8203739.1 capsule assembly Wzi family protein [Pelagicoccus sp. SDUM812003]
MTHFISRLSRSLPAFVLGISVSYPSLFAAPSDTIAPGDEAARYRLSQLSDQGQAELLTSVWPMRLQAVNIELNSLSDSANHPHSSSFDSSKPLSNTATQSLSFQLGSDALPFRAFDSDSRNATELQIARQDRFGPFRAKLSASWVDAPSDDKSLRLDGSYLAVDWSDWTLGFGQVDRWWGPGWQTSLILSNNARPSPGFFFERNTHRASERPIVKWLGPWHFTSFFNQLEGDRHVPHAKLLGARFTFKPLQSLELGLSRTAQWGGDGRPESWSNLVDLILGHDNVGSDGIDLDGSNEPGNQLGGVDFRWTTHIAARRISFYGQLIGEDEAGGLPSREIGMIGLDTPFETPFSQGFLFAEASDTGMNFLNGTMFNSTYNHHIYRSGYRYYGDAIGASIDNDSRLLTLGGYQEVGDGNSFTWKAHYASLNRDGIEARNTVSPTHYQTAGLFASYRHKLSEGATIGIQAHHFLNNSLPVDSGLSKSSVQLMVSLFN